MLKNRSGISLVILVVAALFVLPVVSGLVVVPEGGRNLVYENHTYVVLPEGTYTSVMRVDNVWYVDGVVFSGELVDPFTPAEAGAIDIYGILVVNLFLISLCFGSLKFFGRVPVVVLIVGFFTVIVSLYSVLGSGVFAVSLGVGWLCVFSGVVGGLTMLLVGLGVRVRR